MYKTIDKKEKKEEKKFSPVEAQMMKRLGISPRDLVVPGSESDPYDSDTQYQLQSKAERKSTKLPESTINPEALELANFKLGIDHRLNVNSLQSLLADFQKTSGTNSEINSILSPGMITGIVSKVLKPLFSFKKYFHNRLTLLMEELLMIGFPLFISVNNQISQRTQVERI